MEGRNGHARRHRLRRRHGLRPQGLSGGRSRLRRLGRLRHGGEVRLRVGISYVSEANARANLEAESTAATTYEQVAARARAAWNKQLSQIEIEGGTDEQRRVFTTALYHATMTPTTYSDVNGEYTGMDHKVHHIAAGQSVQYANFSGWDVYRSQFQLLTWLDPNAAATSRRASTTSRSRTTAAGTAGRT